MSDWQGKRNMDQDAAGGGKRTKVEGTKVLHVRGLPQYTSEVELQGVCQPFGIVVQTLILQGKNQGFVQMESADAAASLLAGFDVNPPSIRGKPIYFQHSSRNEITMPANRGGNYGGAQGGGSAQGCILLVTVHNMLVPVTLENLQTIFASYGEVLKIVLFDKNGEFKALIQMNSTESAANAQALLDGKDIFQGCCRLQIGMSNRGELKVAQQSAKSRDFTLGQGAVTQQGMGGMGMGPYGAAGGMGGYGGASSFSQPPSAAAGYYPQGGMGGGMGGMDPSMGMGGMGGGSAVLLVNKLPEGTTPDMLFKLFGVYGDVMRVKILYNKQDTAMVQYFHAQAAQIAQRNLNRAPVLGEELLVTTSKHTEIRMPRADIDQKGAELTKDYTGSQDHRYKMQPVLSTKNMHAPSSVLHCANLHDECSAEELSHFFASQLTPQPLVQFFTTSRKMAYVGMNSVQDAADALIRLHNTKLGPYPIRISFSKKELDALTQDASK